MELIVKPSGDNKFITVAELLELADACRHQEIDPKRIVCADGPISLRNELRGLRIKR
jgi:hypothetical protein